MSDHPSRDPAALDLLGLVDVLGRSGPYRPGRLRHALPAAAGVGMREKVTMVLDEEVDRAYLQRWIGQVSAATTDGRLLG
jgi:hypothetical protein